MIVPTSLSLLVHPHEILESSQFFGQLPPRRSVFFSLFSFIFVDIELIKFSYSVMRRQKTKRTKSVERGTVANLSKYATPDEAAEILQVTSRTTRRVPDKGKIRGARGRAL